MPSCEVPGCLVPSLAHRTLCEVCNARLRHCLRRLMVEDRERERAIVAGMPSTRVDVVRPTVIDVREH